MSDTTTTPLALFGDPGSDHWAVLLGGERPRLAVAPIDAGGAGNPEQIAPEWSAVTIDPDDGQVWNIAGTSQIADLKLELAGADTHTYEDGSALQPCRLSGSTTVAGQKLTLDIPGVVLEDLPRGKIDSVRILGSWFPAGHEISLLSVRPEGAKGQDRDHLDVVARGEEQKLVFDPRLSTTYGPDGRPRKAGVELWLGDDEEGDQHPRRVSGVASGVAIADTAGGYQVEAQALHCLSRGEEGSGVYVLLRPS